MNRFLNLESARTGLLTAESALQRICDADLVRAPTIETVSDVVDLIGAPDGFEGFDVPIYTLEAESVCEAFKGFPDLDAILGVVGLRGLTVEAVAEAVGVAPDVIGGLIAVGRIRYAEEPNRVTPVITASSLEQFLLRYENRALSAEEAAEFLDVSLRDLRRLAMLGRLDFSAEVQNDEWGRPVRSQATFKEATLLEFIERGTIELAVEEKAQFVEVAALLEPFVDELGMQWEPWRPFDARVEQLLEGFTVPADRMPEGQRDEEASQKMLVVETEFARRLLATCSAEDLVRYAHASCAVFSSRFRKMANRRIHDGVEQFVKEKVPGSRGRYEHVQISEYTPPQQKLSQLGHIRAYLATGQLSREAIVEAILARLSNEDHPFIGEELERNAGRKHARTA